MTSILLNITHFIFTLLSCLITSFSSLEQYYFSGDQKENGTFCLCCIALADVVFLYIVLLSF